MSSVKALPVFSTIPESNTKVIIGTHSGSFHCDEALACAMLTLLEDEFPQNNTIIVRSRDSATHKACNILVDVGGDYDPSTHRYDHHQKAFDDLVDKTLSEKYKTKLSSAGLVYKHFGRRILETIVTSNEIAKSIVSEMNADDKCKLIEDLYDRVYKNFMEHIDAIDNGIQVSDSELKYRITTTLSGRVGRLNTKWNSPKDQQTPEYENSQFQKAIEMTGEEFLAVVNGYLEQWLPARSIVLKAVQARHQIDPSGKIIKFEQSAPWAEHLFAIEKELGIENEIQIALFQDNLGSWRVQSVPIEGKAFENRCPLPQEWRGLRDAELEQKSGIAGCIFVHMGGFIGGNKTLDGALAMAVETINQVKEPDTKKQKMNDEQ